MAETNNIKSYMEYLKNIPKSKLNPFDWISKRISILLMYSDVINKHPEDLEESFMKAISENNIEPAISLKEYIVLEIRNFYREAYGRFKDAIPFPESAKVDGIVKEFRDKVVGHLSLDDQKELVAIYELMNEYGFNRIYLEWLDFKDLVFEKLS